MPLVQIESVLISNPSLRLSIWIFAAFQFFYLLTSTGRARTSDEYSTFYIAESIVLRGSTAIPQAVEMHNFYGRFDREGQARAAYPPAQAVLATPWYALGHYVLSRLPGVPAEDTDLIVGFSSCLSSATFAALTVAFFFLLLVRLNVPVRASIFATLMVGLATPLFAYSGWLFSEPVTCAIFLGAALLLFGRVNEPVPLRSAALAGLILGLAAWVRPPNALAIVVFAAALLVRDGRSALRTTIVFCAAAGVGVVGVLSRNMVLFGGLFDFGYPSTADGVSTAIRFDNPLSRGLYGFLLSPGKSVFLFAPPLIPALAGLRRLWKMDRGVATIASALPLVYLLFFAKYSSWEGGYCVGPRYLVPSVVLLCLGLGPVLAGHQIGRRVAAWALLALGAVVQCLSLATSFLEDQAPRGHYYDATWTYRLSYSLSGQAHLFWKYLTTGQPPRLGLGWDRWFVFLHLGGISAVTLSCLGLLMLLGFGVSVVGVAKNMRLASAPSA